jgi:hypothetical protein
VGRVATAEHRPRLDRHSSRRPPAVPRPPGRSRSIHELARRRRDRLRGRDRSPAQYDAESRLSVDVPGPAAARLPEPDDATRQARSHDWGTRRADSSR